MPHVLIVDDDPDIRTTLRVLLEDAGYQVMEAANGQDALTILRTASARFVVLLDERMPQLSGMDVLQVVQDDRRLATMHRFLLLTARRNSLTLALNRLLHHITVPRIEKPFDIDFLLNQVDRAAQTLK